MLLSKARELLQAEGYRVTAVWGLDNCGQLVATHSDNTPYTIPVGGGTVNSDNVSELIKIEHERRAAIAEKLEVQGAIDTIKLGY
jgi:hypothetical protein